MRRLFPFFEHHQLAVLTNNTTVFHGLRRRSMRGPVMGPLRKLTLLATLHDINIHARWIPTHENFFAALLSRRDFSKLANLFPLMDQGSEPSPKTC